MELRPRALVAILFLMCFMSGIVTCLFLYESICHQLVGGLGTSTYLAKERRAGNIDVLEVFAGAGVVWLHSIILIRSPDPHLGV